MAAAAAGTVVLETAGRPEETHDMMCTARWSASIGSQGACWRREQSPRLTWCLARSAVGLNLLWSSVSVQPAAPSTRSEAGGEESALE